MKKLIIATRAFIVTGKLKLEKEKYIQQGMVDLYYQEFLNVPLDESNTIFRKSDFLPVKEEDRKKRLNYYNIS